jgi:hypothetical protein
VWFGRRKEREAERDARLVETLAAALGTALGRVFDSQAHQIEQTSRFLDSLQDLSARKAAQIMGSRGGRRTQERKAKQRELSLSSRGCPLCANPMRRDVTVEMIQEHRKHAPETPELAAPEPSSNGSRV